MGQIDSPWGSQAHLNLINIITRYVNIGFLGKQVIFNFNLFGNQPTMENNK